MYKTILVFFCLAIVTITVNGQKQTIDYVNNMIGTTGANPTEYGGLIPEVSTPFGMTKWTPATRLNMISRRPYHYNDKKLIGFMGTHQPVIWMGDYGFLTIMPQSDKLKIDPLDRAVSFSHDDEISTPYYYKNSFKDTNKKHIKTELVASDKCSFFKFTYPKNSEGILFFEASREPIRTEGAGGYVRFYPDKNEIHIYNSDHQEDNHIGFSIPNFKGYYVLKFDQKFADFGTWKAKTTADSITVNHNYLSNYGKWLGEEVHEKNLELRGRKIGGYVKFKKGIRNASVRIGSSFISFKQAAENINKEIPVQKSFEAQKTETKERWNTLLNKIKIKSSNEDDKILFYSMLYRTLQYPRNISEYGQYYSAFDDKVHKGTSYNAFSTWDTFRSLHPLLQILVPEQINPMMQSLVQMYEQGGWMPKWPNLTYTNSMIGTHCDIILADAYINGFTDFDIKTAWQSIMRNSFIPPLGNDNWRKGDTWTYEARAGIGTYTTLGYVAADATRMSASRTLEFALDDYCVANLAKTLGKKEEFNYFIKRSKNYINIFDTNNQFFRAKNSNGVWAEDEGAFTEGANWTYLFCVMQDASGLIELMGGNKAFVNKLIENFEDGHYRHDNEPGHHYAYMFNHANRLDLTQKWVRPIINKNYKNAPDGLSGNDDAGQMSAWYIFSSLGFYPLTPTEGTYALGLPYFEEIELVLPKNKILKIIARGVSNSNTNFPNIYFNGQKIMSNFMKISDLWKGGVLEFKQ